MTKKTSNKLSFKEEIGLAKIPHIGDILNATILDNRSTIKLNRVNQFIDLVTDSLKSITKEEINIENIKTEEFGDLFESILTRVVRTRSKEKMVRFRNILNQQILNPCEINHIETYLDLVDRLDENEIIILSKLAKIDKIFSSALKNAKNNENKIMETNDSLKKELDRKKDGYANNVETQMNELRRYKILLQDQNSILAENSIYYTHEYYQLSYAQYCFYIQDLISKALLREEIILSKKNIENPTKIIEVTEFGHEFIDFIQGDKDKNE